MKRPKSWTKQPLLSSPHENTACQQAVPPAVVHPSLEYRVTCTLVDCLMSNHAPTQKSLLARHLITALGVLGSLASIVALWHMRNNPAHLTVAIDAVRTTIYQYEESSRLKLLLDDKPLYANVSAARIAMWNYGHTALKGAPLNSVLTPFRIITGEQNPILDATILENTRTLTGLRLEGDHLDQGIATVYWDILEQNDGGIIQIIYQGDHTVSVNVSGSFIGQNSPDYYLLSPGDRYWRIYSTIALPLFLLLGAWNMRHYYYFGRLRKRAFEVNKQEAVDICNKHRRRMLLIDLPLWGFCNIMNAYNFMHWHYSSPPFSF